MMALGPIRKARYFPRAKLKPRFSLAASKCKVQLQPATFSRFSDHSKRPHLGDDKHSFQGKDAAGTGSSLHTSITQFIWHSSPHGCNRLPKWSNSPKKNRCFELWPKKVKPTLWPPHTMHSSSTNSLQARFNTTSLHCHTSRSCWTRNNNPNCEAGPLPETHAQLPTAHRIPRTKEPWLKVEGWVPWHGECRQASHRR